MKLLIGLLLIISSTYGLPTGENFRSPLIQCNNSRQCYPDGINLTTSLINCDQNVCLCYPCFTFDSETGICTVDPCYDFIQDMPNGSCHDLRRSQKDAFIYSFFFSSLGGANFYTGHYELAVIQLVITMILFFLCYLICCYCCCLMECEDDCCECCDMDLSCYPACTLVSCSMMIVMLILVIICWWMIDLLVYGFNQRGDSSNGCSLINNL